MVDTGFWSLKRVLLLSVSWIAGLIGLMVWQIHYLCDGLLASACGIGAVSIVWVQPFVTEAIFPVLLFLGTWLILRKRYIRRNRK